MVRCTSEDRPGTGRCVLKELVGAALGGRHQGEISHVLSQGRGSRFNVARKRPARRRFARCEGLRIGVRSVCPRISRLPDELGNVPSVPEFLWLEQPDPRQ